MRASDDELYDACAWEMDREASAEARESQNVLEQGIATDGYDLEAEVRKYLKGVLDDDEQSLSAVGEAIDYAQDVALRWDAEFEDSWLKEVLGLNPGNPVEIWNWWTAYREASGARAG